MNKIITIRDIAGLCPEEAVWKMMADVSAILNKDEADYYLTPDAIIVDGSTFIVESNHKTESEYLAPEQHESQQSGKQQIIWSLGAIAYYMVTGHIIFGGHGGCYQKNHPSVPLPVLPKGKHTLTDVLHKCICCNPERRITLDELSALTLKGFTTLKKRQCKTLNRPHKEIETVIKNSGDKWPEEMIGI